MTLRWLNVAQATGLISAEGEVRPTIFAEMSALAIETDAANLGQGFPDQDGPEWIRTIAADAIINGENQYPPGRGITELRTAVADHQRRNYGIELNPDTEVLITVGATEAITAAVLAFAGPEDEIVTLEPFYDSHAASIAMSGATHVTVPLLATADGFRLDRQALESSINKRTKVILINTPHNPTGTVLSLEELQLIAEAAKRVDAIVITDEVYEHLTFDGVQHTPLATMPGMAERTLTISSAGKTFSLTGWKIGWITGPAELILAVLAIKQFLTYAAGTPFQGAIAQALVDGHQDIEDLRNSLRARRDLLVRGLQSAGFEVVVPQGTYFVCADVSPFLNESVHNGADFARKLPHLVGVACVPLSAFCHEGSPTADIFSNWVRFTFVKDETTLNTAIDRLKTLNSATA